MVKYVIDELKSEKESLTSGLRSVDNTISVIEYRGEIQINGANLSNGIYLTRQEFGFDDILHSLKTVRTRYENQIAYIDNILVGLEEETE